MHLFIRFFLLLFLIFQFPILAGIKEAKKAYAQKQFQKAIKLFTEYSKENPSDGEPYMFMGYIYESQKDFPRSMIMFRRAV
ncbi:MAG: anaphase-promoting complex, cyclosome, subunit 3, partial [Leptospiraceae bacterium]|nr:anaphase-promoting complex, cyclosome, subunit 3 [Leptospiraceae bacterium]